MNATPHNDTHRVPMDGGDMPANASVAQLFWSEVQPLVAIPP